MNRKVVKVANADRCVTSLPYVPNKVESTESPLLVRRARPQSTSLESDDECSLGASIASGIAWKEIAARVYRTLRTFGACEHFTDDVAQEVLLRLLRVAPRVAAVRDITSYIDRVVRNSLASYRARDRIRSRAMHLLNPDDLATFSCVARHGGDADIDPSARLTANTVAARLGRRAASVHAAWQECGTVKGAARVLNLEPRQIKRVLAKIACQLKIERIKARSAIESCPPRES